MKLKLMQMVTLIVTNKLIEKSSPIHRGNCMIANAVRDLFPNASSISVTKTGLVRFNENNNRYTLNFVDPVESEKVATKIYNFDLGNAVKSFKTKMMVLKKQPVQVRAKLGRTPKTGEARRRGLNGEPHPCVRRYWAIKSEVGGVKSMKVTHLNK